MRYINSRFTYLLTYLVVEQNELSVYRHHGVCKL